MNDRYYFQTSGMDLEAEFQDVAITFARKEWGVGAARVSTLIEDRFAGTDMFVLDVPVDVTVHFDGKNHTTHLANITIDSWLSVSFGIRTGNGRTRFETPVLVIGVDAPGGVCSSNMGIVTDTLKRNIGSLLNRGMDEYFDYADAVAA